MKIELCPRFSHLIVLLGIYLPWVRVHKKVEGQRMCVYVHIRLLARVFGDCPYVRLCSHFCVSQFLPSQEWKQIFFPIKFPEIRQKFVENYSFPILSTVQVFSFC